MGDTTPIRKLRGVLVSRTTARMGLALLMALVLVVSMTTPAAALYDPDEHGDVTPAENPAFPQQCGADVMLVLDSSGSLSQQNLTNIKTAANNTVDTLESSDAISGVGVISFRQPPTADGSEGANTRAPITRLDSSNDVQSVKGAIGNISLQQGEGLTNWEAALLEASKSENDGDGDVANENLNKPADIVILVSDTVPNAYGYPGQVSLNDGSTSFNESTEAATFAANIVNDEGTRVVGVGIPNGTGDEPREEPLRAITNGSDSVAGTPSPQANDYYSLDSSTKLNGTLTQIAEQFDCGVTVEKTNDANRDETFTDDETAPEPGANVTYQVEVTNTGSIDLSIDDYYDDKYGRPVEQSFVGETLEAGSSMVITFEGEAPPENGVKNNTFNVTLSDAGGVELTDRDNTTVRSPDLTPSISVEKLNDANDDGTFTDDETTKMPGDNVTYRVNVTNDGPNNVTIDSFSDDVYTDLTDGDLSGGLVGTTLAPNESVVVTFNGSSPSAENESKPNTFNVTASDGDGDIATAEDQTTVRSPDLIPSISVTKAVDADGNGTFADTETANQPGETVTYRVTVTNDGPNTVNITAYDDTVYDDLSLSLVGTTLAPGESVVVTFNGSSPATEETAKTNEFTVEAIDENDDPATANDTTTVRSPDLTPSIMVTKAVDADGDGAFADTEEADDVGDHVTYRVNVTNDGPNDVTIDSFSDDVYTGLTDGDLNESLLETTLAPDESIVVTFEGSAPSEGDSEKTNTFTVTALDNDDDEASDSDTATVVSPPEENICPRTPGFWQTHNGEYAKGNNPDLTTENLPIYLGNQSGEKSINVSNATTANAVFKAKLTKDSKKSNGITKLYIHLLAAKLNEKAGPGAAIPGKVETTMTEADAFLADYDESDWDSLNKSQQRQVLEWKDTLDSFNNGEYTDESNCIKDWWKEDE